MLSSRAATRSARPPALRAASWGVRRLHAAPCARSPRPVYAGLPYTGAFACGERVPVDHLVVGGGAVGLAVGAALAARFPSRTTYVLERHAFVGMETSSRNSEVVHAGLYYPPASYKTALCLRGRELLYRFCAQHHVPIARTGKLIVGTDPAYFERMQAHVASLPRQLDLLLPPYSAAAASQATSRAKSDTVVPLSPAPLESLSGDQARELEPDLSPSISAAVLSAETGIVDSHTYMQTLVRQLDAAENAELVLGTSVVGISAEDDGEQGASFAIQTVTGDVAHAAAEQTPADVLLAKVVINAAGLDAPLLMNTLLRSGTGPNPHLPGDVASVDKSGAGLVRLNAQGLLPAWYSKGNYASYPRSAGGVGQVKHLIYPTPNFGAPRKDGGGKYAHQSLGTHLTLDLQGNIRFGPDSEWLSPSLSVGTSAGAMDDDDAAADYWAQNLAPMAEDSDRIRQMGADVEQYLPSINAAELAPAYGGIRPKLIGPPSAPAQGEAGFVDFLPLFHTAKGLQAQPLWQFVPPASQAQSQPPLQSHSLSVQEASVQHAPDTAAHNHAGAGALISLLGIESPGLTSSLAIAELVTARVARDVWGDYNPSFRRRGKTEDIGSSGLDAWA